MALMTYRRDAKLYRSEWLYRLYQQFYENDRFDPVRRILDYEPEDEIRQLSTDIDNMDGTDMARQLCDHSTHVGAATMQGCLYRPGYYPGAKDSTPHKYRAWRPVLPWRKGRNEKGRPDRAAFSFSIAC
ncbi:hypothetical protein [Celeribacter sp.]|uniref:hypothetical protein n=1 Tax=Celeribacter sp. TaxID=1890673 RepID=UPI003A8D6FC5